jgi:hypothetical protein
MMFPHTLSRRLALLRHAALIAPLALVASCDVLWPVDPSGPPPHGGYYVAPTGSPTGDGSVTRPWNLATALAHPAAVQPGDTIWLRGGVYKTGALTTRLTGTPVAPIIVRQYPGERATIDGYFTYYSGGYAWFWGFEITNTNLADPGNSGFEIKVPGVKLINLIIHDASWNGIGTWVEAPDNEVYGCLLYNNGRIGTAPGRHAHGIYIQNSTGYKRIHDNILFNGWAHNIHAYGETAPLNNLDFEGNVSFNAGSYTGYGGREYLVGGSVPVQNLRFVSNYGYNNRDNWSMAEAQFGFSDDVVNTNPVITDNYIYGFVRFTYWQRVVFQRNTLLTLAGNPTQDAVFMGVPTLADLANFNWNHNTYRWNWVGGTGQPFQLEVQTPSSKTYYDFSGWKTATGLDAASSSSQAAPTGQHIVLRPNRYEAKRAHIVVFNWSGAATANADLSSVLAPGDYFEIREVQNFYGPPAVTGTYAGGSVALPMAEVTAPLPLGATDFAAFGTGTQFHVFVVLRK